MCRNVGDVMGPSIEGLDRLVRMPTGCGEQNMITFAPNIFVHRYLDSIGKLDVDVKKRTISFMETGESFHFQQNIFLK